MADDAPRSDDPLGRPYPRLRDLLGDERVPVPVELAEAVFTEVGPEGPEPHEYTSQEFHRREVERLWSRVWQLACREDEIAGPGDHVVYEIAERSVLVVRGDDGEIRAFHNVCLHRGRQLRDCSGSVRAFRCPYHGFTWALDGALKNVPSEWDFPQVDPKSFRLKPVRAETWGGFVFLNFDPDAPPLLEQLEDIPEIYQRWPMEGRYTAAHVRKKLRCNWKVALEAFIETLHVADTHPQIAAYVGDEHTQYDVWPNRRHYNRMISPRGVSCPQVGELTQDEILQASQMDDDLVVPEGSSARHEAANRKREILSANYSRDLTWITDCEANDTIQFLIFPNLVCWWGHGSPYSYRFKPLGDDPDQCTMEIFFFVPAPLEGPKPAPAAMTDLDFDTPWTTAKELGKLGAVADQDSSNLAAVQRGLKSGALQRLTLARYSENRIRHLHQTLREYLES